MWSPWERLIDTRCLFHLGRPKRTWAQVKALLCLLKWVKVPLLLLCCIRAYSVGVGQRRLCGAGRQPASCLPKCWRMKEGCWSPGGFDQSAVRGQWRKTHRGASRKQDWAKTGMYTHTKKTPAGSRLSAEVGENADVNNGNNASSLHIRVHLHIEILKGQRAIKHFLVQDAWPK